MPKEGITVESCIIGEWKKNVGDVNVGDVLFTYETDKAEFECESTAAGTLIEKFYEDGDEVPCLVNVCAIGNPGEDTSALKNAPAATAAPAARRSRGSQGRSSAAAAAPAGPCAQAVIMPKGRHHGRVLHHRRMEEECRRCSQRRRYPSSPMRPTRRSSNANPPQPAPCLPKFYEDGDGSRAWPTSAPSAKKGDAYEFLKPGAEVPLLPPLPPPRRGRSRSRRSSRCRSRAQGHLPRAMARLLPTTSTRACRRYRLTAASSSGISTEADRLRRSRCVCRSDRSCSRSC